MFPLGGKPCTQSDNLQLLISYAKDKFEQENLNFYWMKIEKFTNCPGRGYKNKNYQVGKYEEYLIVK